MQSLITSTHQTLKMNTIDLLALINQARKECGENEIRRNDFIARCKDELDGEHYETFVVENNNGTTSEVLNLTKDQCLLVSMRESKSVRRSVVSKLNTPKTALELAREQVAILEALEQTQKQLEHAIATKAEIGSRREATAMNTASQAVKKANALEIELDKSKTYCTIKRMEMLTHGQKYNWRVLKSACIDVGIEPINVFDANYGHVKAYHKDVWLEAYAINLDLLS